MATVGLVPVTAAVQALAAGTTGSQTVSVTAYEVKVGEYVNVAGNDQPTHATAVTASTNTTAVTLNEAIRYATGAGAVLTVYKSCAVKGDYAAGYSEGIVVDGWTVAPQVGQLVAFGTSTGRRVYTVIESYLSAAGEQTLILDRPLELAVANDALCFPGPAGTLNLAFHRDALALVTRPLAVPNNQMGVMAHVGVYNDIAMRVAMQYDINAGGTVVNCDILAGVAVLDEALAVVLQG
jgi:hypothetical protein